MAGLGHWYIELTKQAYWRGSQHLFGNRYVLSGPTPSAADATTAIGAVYAMENALFPNVGAGQGVGFTEGRAYGSGGGAPIATVDYNITVDPASATGFAGPASAYATTKFAGALEDCLDIKIPLQGLNSRGKPVYCRKYYRGFSGTSVGAATDTPINAADAAKMHATLLPLATGFAPNNYVVIGLDGRQPVGTLTVQSFFGTHQVPRGRKRKSSAAASSAASTALLHVLESAAGSAVADTLESGAADLLGF